MFAYTIWVRSSCVLELRVDAGVSVYGCRAEPDGLPSVYIRHHATSVRARPHEIEAIATARSHGAPPA
jgi:hypothetical protein